MRSAVALIAVLLAAACASSGRAPVVERRASARPPARVAQRPVGQKPAPAAPAPVTATQPAADGYYVVKKGDTLYSIALENGADYREVAQWNGLDDPARIQVGQALRVKPPEDAVQIGKPAMVARIESHALEAPRPVQETPKLQPKPPPTADSPEFIWPVKGKVIAGFAEPRSKGIDIDGKVGDPVLAAASGRVTYIGSGIPGLGKLVVIKHDNGFITVYAHNRDILVKEQQPVVQGQKIAVLGASDSDRPKLHFQIRKGSAAVDTLRYLPAP